MARSTEAKSIRRTSDGLRDAIFDELEALRCGESNPTRANAVAKLAGSIVETVRMEMDAQKLAAQVGKKPVPEGGTIKTLALGS